MKQRDRATQYYDQTASNYDKLHGGEKNWEHIRALELSWPLLSQCDITSVVDVGCGTGRSLNWVRQRAADIKLHGVDPSESLLEIARSSVPDAEICLGIGEQLPYSEQSVDLAIATGIMHHVKQPSAVIEEMFRVAKKAVLISDHNNFAFGSSAMRWVRLGLYVTGLLEIAQFLRQGFRTQGYSEDDGWWYPYSLLRDFRLVHDLSEAVYVMPTRRANSPIGNLLLTESHLCLLAIKQKHFLPSLAVRD